VFVHLSRRRDSWTAKLVLYNTKAKGCTTDKGPWYMSAVKGLAMEWLHETFGREECGREVVFLHQAQNKEVLQKVSLEC
jgi:transposase-like protein